MLNNIINTIVKCEFTIPVLDKDNKRVGEYLVTIPLCDIKEFTTDRIVINPIINASDELALAMLDDRLEELELHF